MTTRIIPKKKKSLKVKKPKLKKDFHFVYEPDEFQLEAFQLSKDKEYFGYFMDMGVGKTKVTIDNICYLFLNGKINGVLVIAPGDMYHQWAGHEEAEWEKHAMPYVKENTYIYNWDGDGSKRAEKIREKMLENEKGKLYIVVINVEAVNKIKIRNSRRKMKQRGLSFVEDFVNSHTVMTVVDESDIIKNGNAERTKAVLRLGENSEYRRIMTGTPITESPLDIFCQMMFLSPKILGRSWVAFRSRYAVIEEIYVARNTTRKVITGYKRVEEIKDQIAPYTYRVTKDHLNLPPKTFSKRITKLGKEQERIYNDLREKMITELEDEEYVTVQVILTKMLRLHQVVCGFVRPDESEDVYHIKDHKRYDMLMSLLQNVHYKTVIWCTFRPNVFEIEERIKKKFGKESCLTFMGGMSREERMEKQNQFNKDKDKKFFIATAGRRGLNLFTASICIYYANTLSLVKRIQSEDRLHRRGQKNTCHYIDFFTPGTVEERIFQSYRSKKDLSNLITGDNWKEWI